MTNYDSDTRAALAQAGATALTSGHYQSGPVDPDATRRLQVDQLAVFAPAAHAASALVGSHGMPAVPLNRDTLQPTAAPLATLSDVVEHYRTNYADGVGILAGADPTRTVFAVKGPLAKVRQWLEQIGTEEHHRTGDTGRTTSEWREWRPVPTFTQVAWTPPAPPKAASTVAFGAAVNTDPLALRGDHRDRKAVAERTAWLCWSVPATWAVPPALDAMGELVRGQGLQRLKVRSHKLTDGVEVVAEGVIPWHVRSADGWSLIAPGMPRDTDMPIPAWLLEATGAKWEATR